jgi:hypothetical protein
VPAIVLCARFRSDANHYPVRAISRSDHYPVVVWAQTPCGLCTHLHSDADHYPVRAKSRSDHYLENCVGADFMRVVHASFDVTAQFLASPVTHHSPSKVSLRTFRPGQRPPVVIEGMTAQFLATAVTHQSSSKVRLRDFWRVQ